MVEIHNSADKVLSTSGRDERLAYIIDSVNKGRFVSLREVTEKFSVNIQTARRDVAILDERLVVTKVHGGAIAREDSNLLDIEQRLGIQDVEKRCVAETAASFIQDGDVVFIDGGSTTACLAPFILQKHIHIVTNSLSLVHVLKSGWPNLEIIATGGYYYPKSDVLLGSEAVETVERMQVNKAFLSAAGVTSEGVFNSNMLVVELERAVIRRASDTYLLADSSKLGRTSLMKVCGLDEIDNLVTIGTVPEDIAEAARVANCRIHMCGG